MMTFEDIIEKQYKESLDRVSFASEVKASAGARAQFARTVANKKRAEIRFIRLWSPVIRSAVAHYRRGDVTVAPEVSVEGAEALRKHYEKALLDLLSFDYRDYKAYTPDEVVAFPIVSAISQGVSAEIRRHLPGALASITATMDKRVKQASIIAQEENLSQREAEIFLTNHLQNQRLTIGLTETNWIMETGRKTAVVSAVDPLRDSVRILADMIAEGDFNGARRLGRELEKILKLPVSLSEASLIDSLRDERLIVNPLSQARVLQNVEEQADALNASSKVWQMFGYNTRETHIEANGQEVTPVSEPFSVGGYALQYPGDGSLGAGLEEIINCRCMSVYL